MEEMMTEVEHVISVDNELAEGPLWNEKEQALYWVNIPKGCFYRFFPAIGKHESFEIGIPLGVLGFRASGGLIMATARGLAFWDMNTQLLQYVAEPEAGIPNSHFNDGAVDRRGRFWAGTVVNGKEDGNLYRLDSDLSLHKMETGISCSNGIGWSPDNRIMYYTDSPANAIYAYDFDLASGEITHRRVFVRTPENDGVPDGLAIDSEGFVWSARWDGKKVSRYDPQGKLVQEIKVPARFVSSCTFGGEQLDTLYITTGIGDDPDGEIKRILPWSGDLFCAYPGVKGLPAPRFAG
jgi:sugar lactone lactonase YvrE